MPIIKMLGRRQVSALTQTLAYISREAGNAEITPILHNLRSTPRDHEAIAHEFLTNEAYRKITSNRLYCFHTIISLADLDQEKATPEVLQEIANKYLELRGDILAYAIPHLDTASHHIHVLESGTRYRENKSSGLRKQELHNLKMELECFIEERFPQLEHSKVKHGKGKAYLKEAEYQLIKRKGTSEREQLQKLVQRAYSTAKSKQQFLDTLLDHGYTYYERNSDGIITGVLSESGRKYRFKTLGLSPDQIMALESIHEQQEEEQLLNQLQNIRQNKNPKNRER